jgi:5'-3' exoribonuclease 1
MGIPSYFSYILQKHSHIIKQHKQIPKIDNLFLDSNSIIYDVIQHITNHNQPNIHGIIIKKVIDKINSYISIIQPQGITMISFDGVAPIAKLDQQRERRFKSAYIKQLSQELNLSESTWDTVNITPGTFFMSELNIQLHKYYDLKENIILSTSDERGEGEHKIFEYIRLNPFIWEKTNIIYGLDADLIMLALNHCDINPSIYLLREAPHFINTFVKDLIPHELYILDIQEFADKIVMELEEPIKKKKNIIKDYIFLCFILGNDFLPHFPSLNIRTTGIHTLLSCYKEIILSKELFLTKNNKIKWPNVKKLFKCISIKEEDLIVEELLKREQMEWKIKNRLQGKDNSTKLKKVENIPIIDRTIEKEIDPRNKDWNIKYYESLFPIKFCSKEEICKNYLEGLEWTFIYYQSNCKNWKWKYKYSYPPLIRDLINYIPTKYTELIQTNEESIPTIVQLCYVVPKTSIQLIPRNIYKKLDKNIYTQECLFKWAFCKYFWECHVDLPNIDIEKLVYILK